MHVLGIDAGGTKTVCLLADETGQVLAESRGPGANLHSHGELAVEKVLHEVMDAVLGDRAIVPSAICLGIAGVDRDDDLATMRAIMRRLGPRQARTLIVNDALVALTAGAGEAAGIVVIAGTGSIAYGCNRQGEAARAGGWGHILGDEGSGYWIGREALTAVVRAADGRGSATKLTAEVLAHFAIDSPPRLVHVVYDSELPRAAVAEIGPIVQRAADAGDAVALRILERAADELVSLAGSVAGRLEMRGDAFPFILSGGLFGVVPWLVAELGRRLIEVAPRSSARLLDREPARGAVTLALAEAHGGATVPTYRR